MQDTRKTSIIIKVIMAFIFLLLIEYTILIIYSYEIENRFFNECRDNVKFVISELEIMNPEMVLGNVDTAKLQKEISGILAYYGIDKRLDILAFQRDTGKIIYPIYYKEKRVIGEIERIVKGKIDGKIENKILLGYYFYYKTIDLSIVAYRNKHDIFYYRNVLLISVTIIFITFIIILALIDFRKNRKDLNFLTEITNNLGYAFNLSEMPIRLKEIENKEYNDKMEEKLVKNYNRMINRINIILQRQNNRIKEISKQRSYLRKLAYYYKKFSSDLYKKEDINQNFIDKFSNSRIPVVILSLKLKKYFDEINEIYPEVINRELESLYRYVSSIIKSRNGIINYFEGNYFNIVFGLVPDKQKIYDSCFKSAVLSAREIHNWILSRNRERNITGVLWKEAIGVTGGNGIVGVIGNNLIVIGEVVDLSKKLMKLAERYGVDCVTDSGNRVKDLGFKYRILDRLDAGSENDKSEIYEIFLVEQENIDNAIKLYHHGMEMYFEGNYEISATEFRKVNQLLNPDNPSLIFLDRINLKISQK